MCNNKMTLAALNVSKTGRAIALCLAGCLVFAFAAGSDVLAAGKVRASGMFTAIEDDGSVIIDGKGYLVSAAAIVQDSRGKTVSLSSLLPSRQVVFEYEYAARGFVIIFIQEISRSGE